MKTYYYLFEWFGFLDSFLTVKQLYSACSNQRVRAMKVTCAHTQDLPENGGNDEEGGAVCQPREDAA